MYSITAVMHHIPVLLHEVISILQIQGDSLVVDATFGAGGHTIEILKLYPDVKVVGIDRDASVIQYANNILQEYHNRFHFINDRFSNIDKYFNKNVDAILFDFGVSSMQLDNADRGFSFMQNAELDMRMSQNDEMSAADFINTYSEDDISKVLYFYGDERQSKAIAKEICRIRKIHKIQNTTELCNIIYNVKGKKKEGNINAATKVFQAIRMFVNNELLEIEHALKKLPYILKYNARIATITFHSTEDRVVKKKKKQNRLHFQKINKHVILPSHEEVYNNIRSRSAKLRGFVYA